MPIPPFPRAEFSVDHYTDDIVFIVDENKGKMSITNDAEAITKYVAHHFNNKRIVYRDTEGQWDELVHNKGVFQSFAPYKDEVPSFLPASEK